MDRDARRFHRPARRPRLTRGRVRVYFPAMSSSPRPSPVRLVCFDLGGVLVRIARTWPEACERAGVRLDVDPAAWERHHGLMLRYETGEFDEAGYLRELPTCVAGVTTEHIQRVFDAWIIGMYPGAAELLADLKRVGVKTACLSNTNDRHWRRIMREDAEYRPLAGLDYRFASHELRVMKPDERAYRMVEDGTGLRGESILFFDDKPENVHAARAAGWRAEVIDRVNDAVPQLRDCLSIHGVL